MRWWAVSVLVIAGLTASFLYLRWSFRIQQPRNFSHSQHVKAVISCKECHQDLASLPGTSLCRRCHAGNQAPVSVQWIRVYRIAPDIIFSHEKHTDVQCETCHAQMTAAAAWIREYRFPMNFCMKCHSARNVSNECHTCHMNK